MTINCNKKKIINIKIAKMLKLINNIYYKNNEDYKVRL